MSDVHWAEPQPDKHEKLVDEAHRTGDVELHRAAAELAPFVKITDFTRWLISHDVPDINAEMFTAELMITAPGGQRFGVCAGLTPREAAYVNHEIQALLKNAKRFSLSK